MEYKNPEYNPDSNVVKTKTEYHSCEASAETPSIVIDPSLDVTSFIENISVQINGVRMDDSSTLQSYGWIYKGVNRIFVSPEVLFQDTGKESPRLSRSSELKQLSSAQNVKTGIYRKLIEPTSFYAYNDKTPKLMSGTFDGVFPFSNQCYGLRALSGMQIENGFLSPGSEITIQLHKRNNLDELIEWPKLITANYMDPSKAFEGKSSIRVTLKDLSIVYESFVPEHPGEMSRFAEKTKSWFFDSPTIRLKTLPSGLHYQCDEISLPAGSKLVYLFWMLEAQIFGDSTKNKTKNTRFVFPENLEKVKIHLRGHGDLIHPDGLTNLNTQSSSDLAALKLYHQQLVQKKLYSKPFEDFFPIKPQLQNTAERDYSHDQVLLLDLTPYELKDPTDLIVEHRYSGTGTPEKIYLFAIAVKQMKISCAGTKSWKFETLT